MFITSGTHLSNVHNALKTFRLTFHFAFSARSIITCSPPGVAMAPQTSSSPISCSKSLPLSPSLGPSSSPSNTSALTFAFGAVFLVTRPLLTPIEHQSASQSFEDIQEAPTGFGRASIDLLVLGRSGAGRSGGRDIAVHLLGRLAKFA